MFERLPELVNADEQLVHRGRFLTTTFLVEDGDTLRTAAKIPGARVTIMKEIGHFPMSENPAQFRRYILPVLDEIRAR